MQDVPPPAAPSDNPRGNRTTADRPALKDRQQVSWVDRVEAYLSRLSARDTFWHRIFSLIFLPLAFWSGIRMKRVEEGVYAAVLPFRKFNKNWYNAMAGGALLANAEIAGGMWLFGECGGDYTVVCKNLNYTFLRPCYGPAIYRCHPREDLKALVAAKDEFNLTLDLDVRQQGFRPGEHDKRVGRCEIIFHVTPKTHAKSRRRPSSILMRAASKVRRQSSSDA